jgi:hypothetical protein
MPYIKCCRILLTVKSCPDQCPVPGQRGLNSQIGLNRTVGKVDYFIINCSYDCSAVPGFSRCRPFTGSQGPFPPSVQLSLYLTFPREWMFIVFEFFVLCNPSQHPLYTLTWKNQPLFLAIAGVQTARLFSLFFFILCFIPYLLFWSWLRSITMYLLTSNWLFLVG